MSALTLAASQPWLITSESLDTVLSIAARENDVEALETRLGQKLEHTHEVTTRGSVAVIPVTGPIFRYANLFTRISGATSTEILAQDIQAALDNPRIKSIVLNMDSPGGVASGINELAALVKAGRSKKRIVAYVGGEAASAAYWIASAAHEGRAVAPDFQLQVHERSDAAVVVYAEIATHGVDAIDGGGVLGRSERILGVEDFRGKQNLVLRIVDGDGLRRGRDGADGIVRRDEDGLWNISPIGVAPDPKRIGVGIEPRASVRQRCS